MQVLKIDYGNGHMQLIVEKFFPCKIQDARKIFPLINQYCSAEERAELKAMLSDMDSVCDQESLVHKRLVRNIEMIA